MGEEVEPNATYTLDNVTYCWHQEIQKYSWCPKDPSANQVDTGLLVLMSVIYGATTLTSIYGNGLVIWVITKSKVMRTVNNSFIANLALSDVSLAIFCIPFQFYANLVQRWDLPGFMCKFCPFAQTFSVNVSIFTMIAIAYDRYKAVMKPLGTQTSKTMAKLIICLIWVLSLTLASPLGFFYDLKYMQDEATGIKPFCSPERIPLRSFYSNEEYYDINDMTVFDTYMITLMVCQYICPLSILSYVYARMCTKLWRNQTPGNAQAERDETIILQKRRCIKSMISVVVVFAICWLPYHGFYCAMLFLPSFVDSFQHVRLVFFACHWFAMSNSCYNPFIYAILGEKFSKELKKIAFCQICRGNQVNAIRKKSSQKEEIAMVTINASPSPRHFIGTVSSKC